MKTLQQALLDVVIAFDLDQKKYEKILPSKTM